MVHLRLNERDTQRNPYINFVRALPGPEEGEAARRLEQIAAVYKPVMASYGFRLNSLEEYPFNREFAGRNWNAGETIELVLRTRDGGWAPFLAVVHVMAHELAHIPHMNHLPPHGRLTSEIQARVRALLREGYFGDGFWSAGYRLGDQACVPGDADPQAMVQGYAKQVCGGAQLGRVRGRGTRGRGRGRGRGGANVSHPRPAPPSDPQAGPGEKTEPAPPATGTAKRKRGFQGATLRTGAQTAPNTTRTASKRTRKALPGEGQRLDGAPILPPKRGQRTPSTQAPLERMERLAAIQSRLRAAAGPSPGAGPGTGPGTGPGGNEVVPGPRDAVPTAPSIAPSPVVEPEPKHKLKSRPEVIELD